MMSAELKAGVFVLLAIAALVVMTTKLTQNRFSFAGTKTYYAQVSDATGLLSKTKIKMAGLDVGQIEDIELVGKRARLKLEIASDIAIHTDGFISVKSIGFLGDKYIELQPGSDSNPVLAEGATIPESAPIGGFEQLAAKTTDVLTDLKEITQTLKEALRGETETGEPTAEESRLDRILDNMEEFTAGLASLDKLGELTDKMTDIAANVRDITDRVKRGEGSVGKLLSENETVDNLNATLSGVNKFINRADRLAIILDAHTGALTRISASKTYASLIFQPTYDKYYLIGVVAGPRGLLTIRNTTTNTTATTAPGQSATTTEVVELRDVDQTAISFNVQFAKRFADTTVRIGLFETTGGIGIDQNFFQDRLKLYGEAYRFRRGEKFQLNLGTEFHFFKPFYAWLGGDDIVNTTFRSFFIGAGIRFTDDDIKSIVATAVTAR